MPRGIDDDREDYELLSDFVAQLESADTVAQMEAILSSCLEKLGLRYFAYHVIRANGINGTRLPHAITTYPKRWIEHYLSSRYLEEDPVVGEALRRPLSFLWPEVCAPETLSHSQRHLMEDARDAGISNGLTIPIIGRGVDAASLSVVPDELDASGRLVLIRHRQLLQLLAIHFDRRARSKLLETELIGGSSRRRSLLSPREREVLEWIARGKSTWDIAQILRISEKGVEFHVENARRKLQAFGRTRAVVKALMLGIISP